MPVTINLSPQSMKIEKEVYYIPGLPQFKEGAVLSPKSVNKYIGGKK